MQNKNYTFRSGLSLIELTTAMTVNVIVVLTVGVLLASGNRAWHSTYSLANKKIRQDALAITTALGSTGRKANRLNYIIYNVDGGMLTPETPQTSDPQEVVSGNAVEFRYWDVVCDQTDSYNLMDPAKTATAYALFYLDGDTLKVDYGPYPPGAAPEGGGSRNTSGVTTMTLAENVSTDEDLEVGAFSHTTLNGVGQGCVRTNMILTDPDDGETIKVMTATLMRNIWPR